MASIGKYILAGTAVSQETTLAFANLNFDFSIVKLGAPLEYTELGARLSKKRKREAEDGTLHRTAGKLGALFADDLPKVAHLEKAYGLRVSEIASNNKVNPQGSKSHGAFEDHVGADGTTIWAAATSGKGAMAVHLLACMLARIFNATEAISTWVELVMSRQKELQGRLLEDNFPYQTVTTSQIEISRDQLALWDASARSWLKTADDAKTVQQHQLMLILDNVDCKISMGASFPANVMSPWIKAMEVIDRLLSGIGQTIHDGEVLLGLASWHLYPDMSILGKVTTSVAQKDSLVLPGGNATIGLELSRSINNPGISWSIPLSHLRYYGSSVASHGAVSPDSSWVTFDQFEIVILGSAISGWEAHGDDSSAILEFFLALAERLPVQRIEFAWVNMLIRASKELVRAGPGVSDTSRLLELGKRRHKFLTGAVNPNAFTSLFGFLILEDAQTGCRSFSNLRQITSALVQDKLQLGNLEKAFLSDSSYFHSLQSLGVAATVYADLPDAKIHLAVTRTHLLDFYWAVDPPFNTPDSDRILALSIVASFESGHINIKAEYLRDVYGLSSENSLYISESLFNDPHKLLKKQFLRRIVGNIGRPGTSFLSSPNNHELNVRESRDEDWKVINHAPFDGKVEDHFDKTSLQLSLTGYELPIEAENRGIRDRVANVVETVVSVHDAGSWVLDIDLLPIERIRLERWDNSSLNLWDSNVVIIDLETCCSHDRSNPALIPSQFKVTAIDSWNEVLELPRNASIVRCNENWQARLAIASYLYKIHKQDAVIAKGDLCWSCIADYSLECGISCQNIIVIN